MVYIYIAGWGLTWCQASGGRDPTSCPRIMHVHVFRSDADEQFRHDRNNTEIDTDLWLERIPPILSLIRSCHPFLPGISKHSVFQYINGIYRRGMFSIHHRTFYPALSNRLLSPVAKERLRVSDPLSAVFTIIVTTRTDDVEYLGIDYFFGFLVI